MTAAVERRSPEHQWGYPGSGANVTTATLLLDAAGDILSADLDITAQALADDYVGCRFVNQQPWLGRFLSGLVICPKYAAEQALIVVDATGLDQRRTGT